MKKIFVGIDISKNWIDVCVTLDGKHVSHQQFDNNLRGFKAMLKWIKDFDSNLKEWLLCMEHTGIYGQPLWYFLVEKEITYEDIARFAFRYADELKPHRLPTQVLQRLKMLFAYRDRLVKAKVLIGFLPMK